MKTKWCVAALTVCLLGTQAAPGRRWTDSTGKYSVEAELVSIEDGQVRLRKTDGQEITVPMDRLSEADQRYLESLSKRKPDDEPEPDAKARPEPREPFGAGRSAIEQALGRPTQYEFVQSPLQEAIQRLANHDRIQWYGSSGKKCNVGQVSQPAVCSLFSRQIWKSAPRPLLQICRL